MKRFLYLLTLSALISSCNNGKKEKEIPDGGPCSYEEKIFPAKLIRLDATPDSSVYDAWFEVNKLNDAAADHKDTVHYSPDNSRIPVEQIKKDSIAVGNLYKYVVSTIKSGTCNPHIERIILERY